MGHCRLHVKRHIIIGDVELVFFCFFLKNKQRRGLNSRAGTFTGGTWMRTEGFIIVTDFQSAVSRAFRDGPTYLDKIA